MPIGTRYVFIASMDVDPDKEDLFNEVYDTEHVPYLLEVPGRDRGHPPEGAGLRGVDGRRAALHATWRDPDPGTPSTRSRAPTS